MPLTKKRFPIKLDPKEAAEILKKNLKKKGYNYEIKKEDLYLTIKPYWISFYDILINKENKFTHVNNQIALNAIDNKINEKVIEIFNYSKPIILENIDVPKTEKTQIIIKEPIITQKEAEKSIKKYLMYKFNVLEDQVSLSGVEEIYVPNWKIKLDKFKLKIDAIKGEVNNFDIIPQKQKTKKELLLEVFDDIKHEKKLKDYLSDFLKGILEGIKFIITGIIKNYKIVFWIIIIALLVYLIFL